LDPVHPDNRPDDWERAALESFAQGESEAYRQEIVDGTSYLRLIRPLRAEESCMRCHVEQKYKVGDIRGGLSIAVPMDAVWSVMSAGTLHRIAGYGGMWILGLFGIAFMSRQLRHQIARRDEAEQKLQEANDFLEHRVAQRTAELAEVNQSLESEIIDRRKAEEWLLESEQRFRGYFEQGLVGMAILTAEGEWVEVNSRLCRMLGHTADELVLKTWGELANAEDRPAVEAEFGKIFRGIARNFVADTRLIRKDGRVLPVGISAQCLQKTDGAVDCILVLVQDMTHRRPAS
jgi:PAS domain S-box-containing protein